MDNQQKTGKRLSRIVPIYFVTLFLLFTMILLYWTYQTSNTFITEQLKGNLSQRQINAENALNSIFENLELTVKFISADPLLKKSVAESDKKKAFKILQANLESEIHNRLDILFIKDLNNTIWIDDSSPFFNLLNILPIIAESAAQDDTPTTLFTFPEDISNLVISGKYFPLIDDTSGRVIGSLFGGTVLNDDISLVEGLRKKIQANALMLLHNGQIIASTQYDNEPILETIVGRQPSSADSFKVIKDGFVIHHQNMLIHDHRSPLELIFVIHESIFADIKAAYQSKLFYLGLLVIVLSAITLFLVRRILIAPLDELSSYATQIVHHEQAVFQKGPVFEFNQIGSVMTDTVHGLQETTEQLLKEMVQRQQVLDQLNLHRDTLEQTVENRTRELMEINETLTARNRELDREKTERLHAQEEMKQLAEAVKNSPVSIVITDKRGIIEYVNPKFSELTQFSPEEAIGQTPQILNAGLQPKEHFKDMWETILSGCDWHGEFCNRKKDGELFWELASISPILDKNGEILHFVAVKEDITARKLTEANLQRAQQEAEEASRQKSLFLANMSHEIRTPMNALIGLSELALETSLTDQQFDYLNKIHSSAKGLLKVLNDILDYSKIEAGKLEIEDSLFSLPDLIAQLENLFTHQAIKKNLSLRFRMEENVPSLVYGDQTRLRQVLTNLIGNGLKFTEQGAVTVTISLVNKSNSLSRIKFSVADSGIGIPSEKMTSLFNAFSQADTSHTRKYGGTGLGLAISKELVEMMGGTISVDNTRDKGCIFSFVLKFRNGQGDRNDAPSIEHRLDDQRLEAMHQIDGSHILLVEDNTINQQISAEILAKANVTVEIAENGAVAVKKFQASLRKGTRFSAILMDIQMPVLDGYKATKQIREIESAQTETPSTMPIIAMTAHTMSGDRERGLATGMDDYIGKPVNISELFITLARWIGKEPVSKAVADTSGIQEKQPHQETATEKHIPETLPGVDLHSGIARLEGNSKLYLRLLKDFTEEYSSCCSDAVELLNHKDHTTVKRLFHTIKGVAANLCIYSIQDLAGKLEAAISKEQNSKTLLDRFALAWKELEQSILSLENRGCFLALEEQPASSLDPTHTITLLEDLLSQLHQMDFKAVESWHKIKPYFLNSSKSAAVTEIDVCIGHFNFEKAGKLVSSFLEDLVKESS